MLDTPIPHETYTYAIYQAMHTPVGLSLMLLVNAVFAAYFVYVLLKEIVDKRYGVALLAAIAVLAALADGFVNSTLLLVSLVHGGLK